MSVNSTNNNNTSNNCTALDQIFEPDPDPVLFDSGQGAIDGVHNTAPRFGHGSNISVIFQAQDSTRSAKSDYLRGLLASALAVGCFFVVWMAAIVVLRILGHKRVGFLSGQSVKPPPKPLMSGSGSDDDPDNTTQEEAQKAVVQEQDSSPLLQADDSLEDVAHDTSASLGGSAAQQEAGDEQVVVKSGSAEDDAPENYDVQLQAWQEEMAAVKRRLKRIRIAVLFCSLCIIVCVILMCVYGVDSLIKSLNQVQNGLVNGQNLAEEAIRLIDGQIAKQSNVSATVDQVWEEINGFCPFQNVICANVTTPADCDLTGFPLAGEIEVLLNNTQEYVYDQLVFMRTDLERIIEELVNLNNKAKSYNWAFYVAAAFAALLGVLNLVISSGVVLAWTGRLRGNIWRRIYGIVRNWMILPIFVFLVLVSFIFSMVFIIGSIASADTCYGSPDNNVNYFLVANRDRFATVVYAFLQYWVGGCVKDLVPSEIQSQVNAIGSFTQRLLDFVAMVASQSPEELVRTCGSNATIATAAATAAAASGLAKGTCALANELLALQTYFSCNNWQPLYATVAYEALCYAGTTGFSWIATTQLFIVVFAMVMLTLRVGFVETPDDETEHDEADDASQNVVTAQRGSSGSVGGDDAAAVVY